jgi:hypothetical protein
LVLSGPTGPFEEAVNPVPSAPWHLIAQVAVGSSILENLSALEQVILAGWSGAFFRMTEE